MNNLIKSTFLLLLVTILLVGCSGTPATANNPAPANSTAAPATGTQGYPSPDKPGETASANQVPAAASYPAAGQTAPTAVQPPAASGYPAQSQTLLFTLTGGVSKPVALETLKSLATVSVNIDGKDQTLRKLADALNMIGAATYTKVTATGQSGALTLTKDQVAQAYLDIQADGKIRLLVQGVDANQWPLGVTSINVE